MNKIKRLNIITAQGVSFYVLGHEKVNKIEIGVKYINGDAFDFFIISDKDNNVLVEINCLCPCEIIYM